MDELIQTLVADYKADRITWHDIQDTVEAEVQKTRGGSLLDNFTEVDQVLKQIEAQIYQHD